MIRVELSTSGILYLDYYVRLRKYQDCLFKHLAGFEKKIGCSKFRTSTKVRNSQMIHLEAHRSF